MLGSLVDFNNRPFGLLFFFLSLFPCTKFQRFCLKFTNSEPAKPWASALNPSESRISGVCAPALPISVAQVCSVTARPRR